MSSTTRRIKRFVESPFTNLFVGMVLLVSGLSEAITALEEEFSLRAFHGVGLFGLFQVVGCMPEILEGVSAHTEFVEHLESEHQQSDHGGEDS